MEYKYLKVSISEYTAVCTITNPPKFTLNEYGAIELLNLLQQLENNNDVRILLFTGENPDIFIAHYEIGELASTSEKQQGETTAGKPLELHDMNRLCLSLENSRLITIAALNGGATGGGWEIALACDFRLAKKGKYRFGLPETNVGIIPGAGGTQRMARMAGTARALDLILHGSLFSPEKAFDLGLVHRLYEAEDFNSEAIKFARVLAGRAPVALTAAKTAIQQGIRKQNIEEALLIEQECFDRAMMSEDAAGAMRAWLNHEKYEWKGK